MSPDPSLGSDHTRRIVLNPPASFLESAAAQNAIAAGQVAPPQSNGPIAFAQNGQAVLMPMGSTGSASTGAGSISGGESSTSSTTGTVGSAMGMGVSSPDQKGLDPAVMASIDRQLSAGSNTTPVAAVASAATPVVSAAPTPTVPTPSGPLQSAPALSAVASLDPSASLATPSVSSIDPSASAAASPVLAADPSASASDAAAIASRPFLHSPAFILLMVFSALILFGLIATTISWFLRRRGGSAGCCGGGGRKRSKRDLEADDLSEIVRNFESRRGSYGTNIYSDEGMEKRSSLLAEEMGRGGGAPFLHSGSGDDGMVDIDLNDDPARGGLPRMPAATMPSEDAMIMMGMGGMGSPRLDNQFGTGRLEVRNRAQSDFGDEIQGYGDRSKTVPAQRSWVAERESIVHTGKSFANCAGGLSNLGAGWMRNKSSSSLPSAAGSLPSPFTTKSANGSSDNLSQSSGSTAVSRTQSVKSLNKWDRSESHMTDMSLSELEGKDENVTEESPNRSSTWASNLRTSLLAAISGPAAAIGTRSAPMPDDDKFTRPVLPVHLSRSSTRRSSLSKAGTVNGTSSDTFGRNTGKGLVITEEDEDDGDQYSLAPSAKRDIEAALLGAEGVSRASSTASSFIGERRKSVVPLDMRKSVGSAERWKRYVRSSKAGSTRGRDEVHSLV